MVRPNQGASVQRRDKAAGKPFGLALYANGKTASAAKAVAPASKPADPERPIGFARDDTTPIPRPSTFYGRRQNPVSRDLAAIGLTRGNAPATEQPPSADPSIVPSPADLVPAGIDKSVLAIAEPKRLRDKAHLRFVASQPCLICGRQPSDPHHLRFAQPRAIGLKVSDEFTVPLCRGHHRQLHQVGNEVAWWQDRKINALEIAKQLWEESRAKVTTVNIVESDQKGMPTKRISSRRHSGRALGNWRLAIMRLEGAYSENTLRCYRADFASFEVWCRKSKVRALPASPHAVATFIAELGAEIGTVDPASALRRNPKDPPPDAAAQPRRR